MDVANLENLLLLKISRFTVFHFRVPRRPGTFHLLLLLLLGGDIHCNPGPVRYPCGVCRRSVACTHKGLQCDACINWFHIKCVAVTPTQHETFCDSEEFSWQCPGCLLSHLPSGEDSSLSLLDASQSSYDLSLPIDLFQGPCEGVRLIHHNVQGLNSKLTEITQWLHSAYRLPIILCCSETWLTDRDPVPRFDGFDSFRSPMLQHPVESKKYFPGSTILCRNVCVLSILQFVMKLNSYVPQ